MEIIAYIAGGYLFVGFVNHIVFQDWEDFPSFLSDVLAWPRALFNRK